MLSSNNNDEQVELRERCLLLQSRVEELTRRQQTEMKKPGHIDNKVYYNCKLTGLSCGTFD